MDFSSKSIRSKTIFFSLTITSFILFAGFSFICLRELAFLSAQLENRIEMERRISSSLIQQNYGLGNIIELRRTLQTLSESFKLEQAEFFNDRKESLWRYQSSSTNFKKISDNPGVFSYILIKILKYSNPNLDIRGKQIYCKARVKFANDFLLGYFSWNFSVQNILFETLLRLATIFATFLVLILLFATLV